LNETQQQTDVEEQEHEDGAYGEEAFEEDRPVAVPIDLQQEQQMSTGEEAEYDADFEAGSVVVGEATAGPEESTYGADFEEPSQVEIPVAAKKETEMEDEDARVRHALSESVTGLAIQEAERDLETHPELIHHHNEGEGSAKKQQQPLGSPPAEEEDSYLLDDYEEDSTILRNQSDNGANAQQSQSQPHQQPSIIEQVQQEFDDFDDVDADLAEDE
jgi:hypothetical protein